MCSMRSAEPDEQSDRLLTTTAAARLAERASETIRKWARDGRLNVAYRTESGVRLYRREDVLRAAGRFAR